MNEQVTLIGVATTGNSFDRKKNENKSTIFCEEDSVTQREFFEASGRGIKAEYKLNVWSHEYSGETLAVYKGNQYKIYRTFKKDDKTELYLGNEG